MKFLAEMSGGRIGRDVAALYGSFCVQRLPF